MSSIALNRWPRTTRALTVVSLAALLLATALVRPASAHGSTIDPPSRNYGCWLRWGSDFQNPAMATEDPMCWQAWQHDVNAMWNWNGLYREGVAGNHQAAVPDGTLCSAGQTGDGRYNSLDVPGNWKAVDKPNNFSVKVLDQAGHGADYIRVYVTKQGFNPLTQRLGWGNLDLLGQIGNTPASQWTQVSGGYNVDIPVSAPGRTGRHIVYTVWKASHADQNYYWCADVNFPGGSSTPTATPSSATPSTSSAAPSSAAPSSSPATGTRTCSAAYSVTGQWTGGFQADVKVTAGGSAVSGWTVTWTFANGQQISSAWGATVTASGATVTAKNAAYNGSLAAGGTTSFGFIGSWTGSNAAPAVSCAAV